MKKSVVFLYYTGVDDVLLGSNNVTGIQVQMSFWAKVFAAHGWEVYSLTEHESHSVEGIGFIQKKESWFDRYGFSILYEPFEALKFFRKTHPNVVLVRGARRVLYAIKKASDLIGAKVVFMGASDRDFEPGKELILGSGINPKLYHRAIRNISCFVTQNQQQAENLLKYYGKQSVIIPNIWISQTTNENKETGYAALWVANLRRLKRAEWFIGLAQKLPQYRFAMVGGVSEQDYYDRIKAEVENISNLEFFGPQSLNAVNALLSKSKLLVCTSEFEGFPNTFLQAWSESVPVISTVNPSGVITEYGLGKVVVDEDELLRTTEEILISTTLYEQYKQNINDYFFAHHDAETAYHKMMELVNMTNSTNDQK